MKKQKVQLLLSVGRAILIVMIFTTNLSAIIYLNDSDIGFDESKVKKAPVGKIFQISIQNATFAACSRGILYAKGIQETEIKPIKYYIIKGATCFLKSNSYLYSFLNNVKLSELNTLDYEILKSDIKKAINELEKSRYFYTELKNKANETSYNKDFIGKLKIFDYDAFREPNKLNGDTIEKIKTHLSSESLQERYDEILSKTEEILETAYKIKSKVEVCEFPEESKIWNLNLRSLDMLFFSQHGTTCFLKSNSHLLSFLGNVELSELNGPDYEKLKLDINRAIDEIKKAKNIYTKLRENAKKIRYNQDITAKLKKLNFDASRARNNLKKDILEKIEGYLVNGNIRGIYVEALSNIEEILNIAYNIKSKIEVNELPEESELYDINLSSLKSRLFGQYVAKIFREVKNKKTLRI